MLTSDERLNRKRPVLLSITHKFCPKDEAKLDICHTCESSPHDGVAGRRVFGASQVSSESSQLDEEERNRTLPEASPNLAPTSTELYPLDQLVPDQAGPTPPSNTLQHGHPEDAPTEDAEDGD